MQRAASTALALVILGLLVPPLPAQTPTSAPATTSAPSDAQRRAMSIIDAALAKYRAAKTYADQFEAEFRLVAKDAAGNDAGEQESSTATVAFARPNRVALVTDSSSLHCDGKKLWLFIDALDEYTETAAPETLDWDKLTEELSAGPPHVLMAVLLQPVKPFAELFPMVNEFTAVTLEKRGDRPGLLLTGTFDATETPLDIEDKAVPFTLWFDEKTGLLGELRIDLTKLYRDVFDVPEGGLDAEARANVAPGATASIDTAYARMAFNDVRLDVDIPADRFTFKPPAGAEKTDKFAHYDPNNPPEPKELIGKPAPEFAGDAVDGKPVSLAQLRGRVVVLDFWATWCGPCIMAMPQIQKLHEKYADQPVTILGINEDNKQTSKGIKPLLEKNKVTFRHFPDPKGKLGRKYKLDGIPCTFILDQKGIIRDVHVGYTPELEKELSEKIDALLKGESLTTQPG
jgi:thiol-disulfide isomerase/thioredoxin